MEALTVLRELSETFGPAGFEDQVRTRIAALVEPLADRVEEDAIGNLTAWREGKNDQIIMLDAHTDEVGILTSHVDSNGFVRFVPLGGWDGRLFPGARVLLKGKDGLIPGAVGLKPPHVSQPEERNKAIPSEELTIDIGVSSREVATDLGIVPGAPGILEGAFQELPNGRLLGKAFDDRAGCAAALIVLERLQGKELPFTLAVNFAAGEELGLRGAKVAAFRIAPRLALVLEATTAGDFPSVPEHHCPCRLGAGVALTVADKTMVASPRVLRFLQEVAAECGISYQIKQPISGGTDGGEIHLSRSGVLTGVLAVPCRYIHSPSSILQLSDFQAQIELTLAALERATELL